MPEMGQDAITFVLYFCFTWFWSGLTITNTIARKAIANKLTGKPSIPRLNREGSIGWRDSLLHTKHPMHTL